MKLKKFQNKKDLEAFYLNKVDALAEEERNKHVTPGSGQAMTYQAKYEEALQGEGALIEQEAASLDKPLAEVIESILVSRKSWAITNGLIEGERLKTKKAIRESANAAAMNSRVKEYKSFLSNLAL